MTMLGKKQSKETKRKISESHKGKKKPWAGKYKHLEKFWPIPGWSQRDLDNLK